MFKKFVLGVALMGVLVGSGCAGALLVPAAVGGAVMADRHICQKKGVEPAKVNPDLVELIEKVKPEAAESK
jgi:hypothetical protein